MTCARIVIIAVAHGAAICCLAAATGAISGGHLNPAVTLAFVVAGKETLIRAGLYVGAQVRNATASLSVLYTASLTASLHSLSSQLYTPNFIVRMRMH